MLWYLRQLVHDKAGALSTSRIYDYVVDLFNKYDNIFQIYYFQILSCKLAREAGTTSYFYSSSFVEGQSDLTVLFITATNDDRVMIKETNTRLVQ